MSFSVSYTYKIIDKFTPQLREIEKATEAFNRKIQGITASTTAAGKSLKDLGKDADQAASKVTKATNKLGKGFGKLAGGDMGKRLGSMSGKLNSFATSAGNVAATLGGGLLLGKFTTDAMGLEDSIINLRKGIDFANEAELTAFQAKLAAVGKVIGQSKTEMNNLGYAAGKMGIAMNEIPDFALLSGKVAVAFDLPLEEATSVLADLRTKFGLSSNKELESALDTINFIDDKSNASAKNMLNIMARVSGMAKNMKIPVDKLAGFSATAEMIMPRDRPELAASGMEMFIQKLQDQAKFKPEVAKGLVEDFEGTIRDILGQFNKMDDATRNIKIQEVFGLNAVTFVSTLASNMGVLDANMKLAADKTAAAGSQTREFEKRTQAASFALQKMKADLTDVAGETGTVLLPIIKDLAKWIGEIAPKISEWVKENPGITKFGLAVLGISVALAPVALFMSAMVTSIGALIPLFTMLTPLLLAGIPAAVGFMAPFLPLAAVAVAALAAYQSVRLLIELMNGFTAPDLGFVQTMKDLGSAFNPWSNVDDPNMNLAVNKTSTSTATLGGNIGVTVDGPGKITSANLGPVSVNRGTNVAGKLP